MKAMTEKLMIRGAIASGLLAVVALTYSAFESYRRLIADGTPFSEGTYWEGYIAGGLLFVLAMVMRHAYDFLTIERLREELAMTQASEALSDALLNRVADAIQEHANETESTPLTEDDYEMLMNWRTQR